MRSIQTSISAQPGNGKRRGWVPAFLGVLAALMTGCATTPMSRVKDTSRSFQTVVIDAGHGGHDYGARTRWGGAEKTAALEVARRLEPKLRSAGFHTVMTRNGDQFIPLNQRASISNRQQNAVFVSIHFNHSRKRRIHGAEVYYKSAASRELARRILRNVASVPGVSGRGVITANFRVLRLNQFPAVLVECGYLSNPKEGRRAASSRHREKLASAIASAIVEQRAGSPRGTQTVAAR